MTEPIAMLSRPTDTSIFGKCSGRLDVPAAEELIDLYRMLAALEGVAMASYARKVLEDHGLRERERLKRIINTFGGDVEARNLP